MEILEGEDAILPCEFTTISSSPSLYWYRQYGNQSPEQILTAYRYEDNHFQEGKFSTTLVFGSPNSVPLNIRSVSLLDGALQKNHYEELTLKYLEAEESDTQGNKIRKYKDRTVGTKETILLKERTINPKYGTSQSDLVSQKQNNMEIQEGEDATLPCDFKTLSSNPYLYWYRQYKHQRPERILTAYKARSSNNHFREGKFSTTLVLENQNSVPLKIGSVSLLDGAVYFCTLSPTVNHLCIQIHTKSTK
ncbi:hypothetical protein Chor_009611 [Crotalus horridus]